MSKLLTQLAIHETKESQLGTNEPRATDASFARAKLEEDLYRTANARPKPLADPMALPGLDIEKRLASFKVRLEKATRTWCDWRDKAPDHQIFAARLGQGPGKDLCHQFREARSWVQETAKQLDISKQLDRHSSPSRKR